MAKTIFVEILANATQFKKELERAVVSTNKANSGFSRMSKVAGVAGLALGGALALGLEKSVAAAVDAQDSQRRLDQAFKNTGLSMDSYKDSINSVQDVGRKLGFTDTDVRDSLGSLITATGNVGASMKDLSVAQDLARFTGKDLVTTTKFMTMAMTGSQKAIKALGINVSPVTKNVDALRASHLDLATAAGKAALAHAKLLDKMATGQAVINASALAAHGQGQAFADTAAGGMAQFHAQLDHLEVTIGQGLLPALTAVAEKLATVVEFFAKHTTTAKILVTALAGLAAVLLAVSVASSIAAASILILDVALSPLLIPVAAAIAAIALLSFVVYKLVSDFRKNWPLLLPIVMGPLGAIIAAVIHWHSQITGAFTAAWNTIKSVTTAGINAVLGAIRGAVGAAVAAAQAVGTGIVNGLRAGLAAIVGAVTGAFGKVWAFLKGLVGVAAGVGASIGAAVVSGFISGLSSLASRAAGIVRDAISHLPHISIPGHSPIEDVGFHIGQLISSGMVRGLKDGSPKLHQELVSGVQDAKAGADNWIDTTGVANMTEKGTELAHALAGGFAGAHEALIGAIQNAKDLQLTGAALVNAPARPMSGPGGLAGSALVNAPPIVLNATLNLDGDVIYRNQKRYAAYDMNRNGGTGIRA